MKQANETQQSTQAGQDQMQALVCTGYGPPDVLQIQQIEKPVPQDNELLIKVHAATATTAGLIGRSGKPYFTRLFSGLTEPKNKILGIELAGEVVAIGKDVTRFKVGDQVFGMTGAKTLGAYVQFKCLAEDQALLTKPENMSYEESAAIVEGGLTAVNFLKHNAGIQQGQKVLINGASGAVGTAAVQVAKYYGADVTGVCSGANLEMVKALGADNVIDYTQEDFTKNGQSYDIIFDTVGKSSFSQCKASLKPNGIYLDSGNVSTVFPMLWTSLVGGKKAIMAATYLRSASETREDLALLKEMAEAGHIKAAIDRQYPLAQTAEAHTYVETGRKKGNVVINIPHDN